MTASQALRKGSKKFAEELSALTGKKEGVGPPSDLFLVGTKVKVLNNKDNKWLESHSISANFKNQLI